MEFHYNNLYATLYAVYIINFITLYTSMYSVHHYNTFYI